MMRFAGEPELRLSVLSYPRTHEQLNGVVVTPQKDLSFQSDLEQEVARSSYMLLILTGEGCDMGDSYRDAGCLMRVNDS